MSDFEFREENTIEAVFSMEVGREMNDHNKLYNRYADDQHPMSAITGLTEALAGQTSDLQAETSRAEAAEQALDDKIEAETTRAEGAESGLNTAIGNETTARIQADTTLQSNITAEENRAKGVENGLRLDLTAETTARQDADTGLQNQITTNANDIDSIEDKIPSEASSSNQLADKSYVDTADNNLQSQIDAISASSDVTDIVGTYAELQNYDTSTLTNDDIIKVLQDESQGGATTYYRWVLSGSTGSFVLIGSEGPYYTKAEADELYDEKQNEITATNKLDSDLVDDSGQTNKFVTSAEKTQITTNASDIASLQTDKADKSTTYTKTDVDTIASGKANVSLDNLNADGQMIIDSANGTISNCILEIPQNIKVELANNVLTLKSGSVLALTGSSTYTTITITSDKTKDFSSYRDGDIVVFSNSVGGLGQDGLLNRTGSGNTLPSDGSTYSWYYLTTDYNIYHWENSTWTKKTVTYPLCILHKSENTVTFAKDSHGNDMIFNGCGFIGHHAFVYPNVKALVSDRFNEDGSLKSRQTTTNSLQILEMGGTGTDQNWYVRLYSNGTISSGRCREYNTIEDIDVTGGIGCYIKNQNAVIVANTLAQTWYTPLINFAGDGTTVTNFTIRQPVHLATTEMLDKVQDQVDTKQDTLVSGTNIKTINSTSVLGSGNFALADQSLSNLDSTGQMVVDSQNGTISNCVLEIPQNIKVALENNVLTLKTGSTLVKFGDVYSTTTLTSDIITNIDVSTDGRFFIIGTAVNQSQLSINKFSSGETTPTTKTTDYFWNVTDKLMYLWRSSNEYLPFSTWYYPNCVIDVVNGVASFAKDSNGNNMIFNGAGFIGHHAFVYPNVTVLYPWGYTDDKHLNSVSVTTNQLYITELATNRNTININGYSNQVSLTTNGADLSHMSEVTDNNIYHYITSENYICIGTSSGVVNRQLTPFVGYTYDGTTVTKFDIIQPYEGARNLLTDDIEEEVATKQVDVTTLTGYDSTQTQTLKNINGVLQWVTD